MNANKLVRDKIPQIMRDHGGCPNVRIADDDEYSLMLRAKLIEEVGEFLSSGEPTEIVDVLEVLLAIAKSMGINRGELEALRLRKVSERGSFNDRVVWCRDQAEGLAQHHEIGGAAP